MFDAVELNGTPDESIALQTRLKRDIPNYQAVEPDDQARRSFDRLLQKHPDWVARKGACGLYNCAGLVWASRRTSIEDEDNYVQILKDDGYQCRKANELPAVGDLAIYRLKDPSRLIHVGVVVELKQAFGAKIPWVLSKWNDSFGESLHHLEDVAFRDHFNRNDYDIEFWADA